MTAEAIWPDAPVTRTRIRNSSRKGMSSGVVTVALNDTRCHQLEFPLMARWKSDAEIRLITSAIALFDEQGYNETTVAEIAAAAGLTKRTFFRYFADKREVLFNGSHELSDRWLGGIDAAAPDAAPMAAVSAGLDAVAELFAGRHSLARIRFRIVEANPELQERELMKLQSLAEAIRATLLNRGVGSEAATLAARAGVTVFHVAFARWVQQEDPDTLNRLIHDSIAELRSVLSG
jgi:AcrR family transcriptional regulator